MISYEQSSTYFIDDKLSFLSAIINISFDIDANSYFVLLQVYDCSPHRCLNTFRRTSGLNTINPITSAKIVAKS